MIEEIETPELVFKANLVAAHLKDIGFYAEHEIVAQLLQQRAELLDIARKLVEASNKSRDALEFSVMCDEFISEAAEALQKADQ